MTSVRITPASSTVTPEGVDARARLTIKPPAPVTGSVDGGWWPRSRDLAAEAPALLAALDERLARAEGVTYNLDDWGPTPRRIEVGRARIRLSGYRSQHPDTIDVHGRGRRVTLLVVAPETTEPVARAALRAAAHPASTDGVEALLLAHNTDSADESR